MRIRARFIIQAGIAFVFALLTALTLSVPEWIEFVFDAEPDSGSGTAEWGVTAAFGIAALIASVLAGKDWLYLRIAASQAQARHIR